MVYWIRTNDGNFSESNFKRRTIREIIVAIGIIAPIITTFWFTILGGSGVFYELMNPRSISDALSESGMPAAMIAITGQLPLSNIIGPAFLLLTILFVVTTGDSMAYSISMAVTGDGDPRISLRIFGRLLWAQLQQFFYIWVKEVLMRYNRLSW